MQQELDYLQAEATAAQSISIESQVGRSVLDADRR